jgi:hypothetical protein
MVAMIGVLTACLARADEQPQPPVFLWTHGHFQDAADKETGMFLALSYCGEDDSDPSLPALNVAGNVALLIAGRRTNFTILRNDRVNREHIQVVIPADSLPGNRAEPFKIQWSVGDMKSNELDADFSKRTVQSTTLYPTTPRPKELQGVDRLAYVDYNWREETETRYLDKQRMITLFFNGDGPKPWRFRYWSSAYVYGVLGKSETLETGRSIYGDVSNDEVLELWKKLAELGIQMPSWQDGPKSEVGQNWDWFFFTNTDGKRVFTERDEEYYKIARELEFPLKIEFEHKKSGIESSCEYSARRDSKMWKSITDVFVGYSNRKSEEPSMKREITLLKTQGDDQPCVNLSLQELLADPKKYHGKRVRVSGYHHSEFEHSSLSAGPDSIRRYNESVWLGGMSHFAKPEQVPAHNDAFITAEGTFTAGQGGHMGLWAGEIGRLTKIQKRSTEQDGADQPATAPESKPDGDSKPQSESEGRSQ